MTPFVFAWRVVFCEKKVERKNTEKSARARSGIVFAAGLIVLRDRKHRRNILFGLTLLTLFLVFGGTVFLGDKLMEHPWAFVLFWLICFLSVGLLLMLAIYDIGRVRREHHRRVNDLDREFHDVSKNAKRLAESELKKDANDD